MRLHLQEERGLHKKQKHMSHISDENIMDLYAMDVYSLVWRESADILGVGF